MTFVMELLLIMLVTTWCPALKTQTGPKQGQRL